MPRLSVWFVRAALLYLLVGFVLGALLLAQKGIPYAAAIWVTFPAHMEFLLVGWLVQVAMGVAYWILPRYGRAAPRGREAPLRASFLLLNGGILLVALQALHPALLITGRLGEAAAVVMFAVSSWPRVKAHGV